MEKLILRQPPSSFTGKTVFHEGSDCTAAERKMPLPAAVSTDKKLYPVIRAGWAFYMGNADFCIGCVQDIGTVAGAVHPVIHDLLCRGLTIGNILSGGAVGDTGFFKYSGEILSARTSVGERGLDFRGPDGSSAGQRGIQGKS